MILLCAYIGRVVILVFLLRLHACLAFISGYARYKSKAGMQALHRLRRAKQKNKAIATLGRQTMKQKNQPKHKGRSLQLLRTIKHNKITAQGKITAVGCNQTPMGKPIILNTLTFAYKAVF
jgi:hypothetical protein